MITNRDILVIAEHRKDAMARAEKERLIQKALQRDAPVPRVYRHLLVRLGAQMVAWGSRLQARYANS